MKNLKVLFTVLCVAYATAVWGEEVEIYRESFVSTTTKAAAATKDKVTATKSMFYDKEAEVWSHYISCAYISKNNTKTHTQTYCTGKTKTSIQHTASAASTEYTILEVTGIDISNTTNLKLYYAFYFSGGTNYIAYAKIDDGSYVQIATATSGTAWQYVTDKSISGTGNKLSLKFTYKSNKNSNAFYLDEIYVTGTKSSGSTETTYSVTFNAGTNGTCNTQSLTESSIGSGVTLPDCTPNTGYTFVGWATTSSATKADAGAAGVNYKPNSNCKLYAVYSANQITWTITFEDKMHGTAIASQMVSDGGTFTFPSVEDKTKEAGTCAGEHYHFVGWLPSTHTATSITDADVQTAGTTSKAVTADATYYAVWAKEAE